MCPRQTRQWLRHDRDNKHDGIHVGVVGILSEQLKQEARVARLIHSSSTKQKTERPVDLSVGIPANIITIHQYIGLIGDVQS